jgi:hypothetical protein
MFKSVNFLRFPYHIFKWMITFTWGWIFLFHESKLTVPVNRKQHTFLFSMQRCSNFGGAVRCQAWGVSGPNLNQGHTPLRFSRFSGFTLKHCVNMRYGRALSTQFITRYNFSLIVLGESYKDSKQNKQNKLPNSVAWVLERIKPTDRRLLTKFWG